MLRIDHKGFRDVAALLWPWFAPTWVKNMPPEIDRLAHLVQAGHPFNNDTRIVTFDTQPWQQLDPQAPLAYLGMVCDRVVRHHRPDLLSTHLPVDAQTKLADSLVRLLARETRERPAKSAVTIQAAMTLLNTVMASCPDASSQALSTLQKLPSYEQISLFRSTTIAAALVANRQEGPIFRILAQMPKAVQQDLLFRPLGNHTTVLAAQLAGRSGWAARQVRYIFDQLDTSVKTDALKTPGLAVNLVQAGHADAVVACIETLASSQDKKAILYRSEVSTVLVQKGFLPRLCSWLEAMEADDKVSVLRDPALWRAWEQKGQLPKLVDVVKTLSFRQQHILLGALSHVIEPWPDTPDKQALDALYHTAKTAVKADQPIPSKPGVKHTRPSPPLNTHNR